VPARSPLLRRMKVLYLDESGDHSLTRIDPQYPVFVLGGIIVDQAYARDEMEPSLRAFKIRMFARENLVLHTADITRNRNGFERLQDPAFRTAFRTELNQLMRRLEYQVIACVIRKDQHLEEDTVAALDPYFLGLRFLVERFGLELGPGPGRGLVVAEKRGVTLDRQLRLAWLDLQVRGTCRIRAAEVRRRIEDLVLHDKLAGIAALELADLVVTPIGRFVLGKPVQEDFRIIERKLLRDAAGNPVGTGLIVLPK